MALIKTATEQFGDDWHNIDVIVMRKKETIRDIADGYSPFTRAVNTLIRSMLRIDSGHLTGYSRGKYKQLRAGMFTLADMANEHRLHKTGKYIYDYGAVSSDLMDIFFDNPEPLTQPKNKQSAHTHLITSNLDEIIKRAHDLRMSQNHPHREAQIRDAMSAIISAATQAKLLTQLEDPYA